MKDMTYMDKAHILSVLPQRDPFLFIDEATLLDAEKGIITASYRVRGDEEFFKGHFPDNPILPGVILLEGLAQTCALMLFSYDAYKGKLALFAKADDVRFKRVVRPGDVLTYRSEMVTLRPRLAVGKCVATVGDEIACQAEVTSIILDGGSR